MHRRKSPVAALLATAALLTVGLPSAAQAASPSGAQASVGQHLQKAQVAARRVTRLSRRGQDAAARKALKTARHEAVAAARSARALARSASTDPAAASTAIWSMTAAAGTYGNLLQQFASLIPQAGSSGLQQSLATALPGTIAGRDQLIAQLSAMVDELTGDAQTLAAQALAALQASAPEQVQQLATVAGLTDLPAQILTIVQQALGTASSALKTGLSTLNAVLPQLPDAAQAGITTALSTITSMMQQILPMMQQILGMVMPAASSPMEQGTGIIQSLLGNLLGGFLGGGSTGTGTSSGGLFGGLLGSLPTGLPTGFLGGLTGLFGGLGSAG